MLHTLHTQDKAEYYVCTSVRVILSELFFCLIITVLLLCEPISLLVNNMSVIIRMSSDGRCCFSLPQLIRGALVWYAVTLRGSRIIEIILLN